MRPPHDHGSKPTPTPFPSSLSHCRRRFLVTVPFRCPPSPSLHHHPLHSVLRPSTSPLFLWASVTRYADLHRISVLLFAVQFSVSAHQDFVYKFQSQAYFSSRSRTTSTTYPLFRRSSIHLLVSLLPRRLHLPSQRRHPHLHPSSSRSLVRKKLRRTPPHLLHGTFVLPSGAEVAPIRLLIHWLQRLDLLWDRRVRVWCKDGYLRVPRILYAIYNKYCTFDFNPFHICTLSLYKPSLSIPMYSLDATIPHAIVCDRLRWIMQILKLSQNSSCHTAN
ncbi:hypothetical protein DFH08DRAFT_460272 [Mycena albidolilacea]|uniref:Uncharacterized protein n=1 Tax=Mycena albidolilacea TaxID=1033008 RepID=A0AAD7EYS8_9AGAR|nr:hypothetical protein DFH08DRAFT_460272 [Mycena albidolilacea]